MPLHGTVSGSHTHLKDGGSYLRAGSNVTISSASAGGETQVTIAAAAAGAAGSNTQVMFNDGGSLAGDSGMIFNKSSNTFTIDNVVPTVVFANSLTTPVKISRGTQSSIYGGNDAVLFVSGAQTSFGQADNGTPRAAVFGGDVVASGTIRGGYIPAMGLTMLNLKGNVITAGAGIIPLLSAQGGPGADTNFFVSGSTGDRQNSQKGGIAGFGGDMVVSGSAFLGQGLAKPTTTVLTVEGNVSSDFVAKIDNDQSSAGHILKLTTDGNGSGTTMMAMEDGDGDTLFKARADGRFGFGTAGVSSMGAGTFVVGISGDHTADIAISKRLQHLGDSDTYIDFDTDEIKVFAGNVSLIEGFESSNHGKVLILSGGSGDSINPSGFSDTNFFVSGSVGGRSGASTHGTATFGGDMCISGTLHITGSDVANVAGKSVTFIGHGGRPVTGGPVAVSASSSGVTISAATIVASNGVMATGRASGQSDTTDTAANIIAQIPLPSPGLQIDFVYMNLSSNSVTLAGGSGVIMANTSTASFAIAAGKGRAFRFAINSGLASVMLLPVSDSFNLNS